MSRKIHASRRSAESTIATILADSLSGVTYAQASEKVQAKVRDCLLHGLVVAAGAGETTYPDIVRTVAAESLQLSRGGGQVLLGMGRAPAADAAWANAVMCHARVQEDTHDTVHPGVVVIPAALAVAEREGRAGSDLLDAVLRGYEAAVVLSGVLNARVTPPMRATGAFGAVAAAVAASTALGLGRDGVTTAIALAASMSGGTTESFAAGTQEWHFQVGQASHTGVVAADLAAAGVSASPSAFEGPGGFLEAYAKGVLDGDLASFAERLRVGEGILEVTFKPYPVCAFNQAPAAAAVSMHGDLEGRTVTSAQIRMSVAEATYPGVDNSGPITSPEQAIMSVQCAVAVALLDGNVAFRRLHAAESADVSEVIERLVVVSDSSLPNKRSVITAELSDGSAVEVASPDMDEALRWDPVEVAANAVRMLPETNLDAEQLLGLTTALENLSSASSLEELLRRLP